MTTPPAPDSVRVWRGFRLISDGEKPAEAETDYLELIGNAFVPSTVKMQTRIGLNAYIPAFQGFMPGKPAKVPDETAILFWETPQTYWDGFGTLAVRTYTLTHHGVYNFAPPGKSAATTPRASTADFPNSSVFTGTLIPGTPVYLFNQATDWMKGRVNHFVAAQPEGMSTEDFSNCVSKALTEIQTNPGNELEGAIACIGDGYLVYWELLSWDISGSLGKGYGPEVGKQVLQPVLPAWNASFRVTPTYIPVGLWERWEGMNVQPGNAFNMQFQRRWENSE